MSNVIIKAAVVFVNRWEMTDDKTGEIRRGGRLVALEPVDTTDDFNKNSKGSIVQEFSCEHEVFEQLPANFKAGDALSLIATLKTARDKMNQRVQKLHILGLEQPARQPVKVDAK